MVKYGNQEPRRKKTVIEILISRNGISDTRTGEKSHRHTSETNTTAPDQLLHESNRLKTPTNVEISRKDTVYKQKPIAKEKALGYICVVC